MSKSSSRSDRKRPLGAIVGNTNVELDVKEKENDRKGSSIEPCPNLPKCLASRKELDLI
jgi:hypothetical protein